MPVTLRPLDYVAVVTVLVLALAVTGVGDRLDNWPPPPPRPRSPLAHDPETRCTRCTACPCQAGDLTQYRVSPAGPVCTRCPAGTGVLCPNIPTPSRSRSS